MALNWTVAALISITVWIQASVMCDYQKVSEKCDILFPAKCRVFFSTPIQKDDYYTLSSVFLLLDSTKVTLRDSKFKMTLVHVWWALAQSSTSSLSVLAAFPFPLSPLSSNWQTTLTITPVTSFRVESRKNQKQSV